MAFIKPNVNLKWNLGIIFLKEFQAFSDNNQITDSKSPFMDELCISIFIAYTHGTP